MQTEFSQVHPDQPTVARLREATRGLHLSLHQHTLIVQLLKRPSIEGYRAVLEGFLRFYQVAEPAVVEGAERLGVAEQYPRPDRTCWLSADLEVLDCSRQRADRLSNEHAVAPMAEIGELAGWLYVIRGSALGGVTILQRLERGLDVRQCSRFFRAHGDRTTEVWHEFQRFCNDACRCEKSRQTAIGGAREAFSSIADCLTWSTKQSRSHNSIRAHVGELEKICGHSDPKVEDPS